MPEPLPPIDYSSRDWQSLRSDLIAAKRTRMPEWSSESPNDFGIVLIELFAYVGDMLSFYSDRIANEAFLDTAVLRSSVYSIAKMLDYRPTGPGAATTTLSFTTPTSAGVVTIPAGTQVQSIPDPGRAPIIFETTAEISIGAGGGSMTVTATQGQTVSNEIVGASTATLYQRFALFRSPVVDGSVAVTVTETDTALQWAYADHLIDMGPNDPVFTTSVDEGGITWIEFGDDVNGRVPISGAAIQATYRVADGSLGNVAAGTLTQLTSPVVVAGVTQPIQSVTNTIDATGGTDPETIDSIRQNAPRSLTAINRAVTVDDFAALARRVVGVGKAKATGTSPTAVTVLLAPASWSASSPPGPVASTVKTAVLNYLAPRQLIGTVVTISDPTYVGVDITITINVLPTYRQDAVVTAVRNAVTALFGSDAVDFGRRLTLSSVYHAINTTEGVDYGTVSMLGRTPGTPGTAADAVMANAEIPTVGTITVNATGGIV